MAIILIVPSRSIRNCTIVLSVLFSALLRFLVALHAHSGQSKPPMYGDYEAQRHWMEITVNLPVNDWYRNTTTNDLQYWGLDYPPLTAYHSWITGQVAAAINTSYIDLHTSRGLETVPHKTFMRWSVFVVDFFLFFPAILHYFHVLYEKHSLSNGQQWLALALIYPGFIIIDHGHFQYNCISLGLTVAAVSFLLLNKILVSAIFFSLALNYKQMSLYHALPFFIYMLSLSFKKPNFTSSVFLLLKLGCTVLATFLIVWYPFLVVRNSALDVVLRIFPVSRGIFEDKVANVWCAINVIYKLRFVPADVLIRLCAAVTLTCSTPSLVSLYRHPTHRQFLLSLINVSLAFFLFSFQVHEKSILLVALPVLLYTPFNPLPSSWFLTISYFSLLHLAIKDSLLGPFLALGTLFVVLLANNETLLTATKNRLIGRLIKVSFLGSILIVFGFIFIEPPSRLPDLWPLINAIYSATHFVAFFLYFNWSQIFQAHD